MSPPHTARNKRAKRGNAPRKGRIFSKAAACAELLWARPRQHDLELREKPGLRLDIDATAMLLYDDVVAHRQTKPGTFRLKAWS
jgi:hypothetical protein